MDRPRDLLAYLLQLVTIISATTIAAMLWINRYVMYPAMAVADPVMYQLTRIVEQVILQLAQFTMLVMNDVAGITASTMDTLTVVVIYSIYVWTGAVIQTLQAAAQLPSTEVAIDIEVPGGVTVWLVVLFAVMTYAFVYRQYPSHEDWVSTVVSIVLPFLSRWLWKSD